MASRDLNDADPALAAMCLAAKAKYQAAHPGVVVEWNSVQRLPAEQFELYKKGRHLNDQGLWVLNDPVHRSGIVTNCDGYHTLSEHNRTPKSRAVDFDLVVAGVIDWKVQDGYIEFGHLVVAEGGEYGGDWTSWQDWDHVQLRGTP